MAVYRVDQYGRTYYGPNPELPSFDETTFEAYSVGYEGIYLEWANPAGEFTGFRLVSSLEGYPRTSDDGTLRIESGVSAPTFFIDNAVVPGRFHYYAIFLKIQNVWLRAGIASTLHVKNYAMVPWLWERIPIHHRLLQGSNITVDADSNETMLRFIAMLGYGLDRARTSMQAVVDSTDIRTTHITTVGHRSASLGEPIPEGLAAKQARVMALDSAYLASERGQSSAMRAAGRVASGWDVELRDTYNVLPSFDMAEQINPVAPEWDASVRYAVGAVVQVDFWLYRCIVAAFGIDQVPPGNGSNNTWWTVHTDVRADTVAYDSARLTQHGWAGVSHTVGVASSLVVPKIGLGVPHPITGDHNANALTVHNTHASAVTIAAFSLPANPTADPLIPIGQGVVLPRVLPWDAETIYHAEDLVEYIGQVWRAVREVVGYRPGQHAAWVRNSLDKRLRLTLSGYTHQAHGTAQAVAAVTPYVSWYDEYGKLIGTSTATSAADTRVADTFTTFAQSRQVVARTETFTVPGAGSYRVTGRFQQTGNWTLDISVEWRNSSGATLGISSLSQITPAVGSWSNPDTTVTAPSNTAKGIMRAVFTGTASTPSILYGDNFIFAAAATPNTPLNAQPYFDNTIYPWTATGGTVTRTTDVVWSTASMKLTPAEHDALAPLGGRITEQGAKTWSSLVMGFIRDSFTDGSVRPVEDTNRAMSVVDYGSANATTAVTVTTTPSGGLNQGLVLRVSDASNYFRASRTTLARVQAGVVTTLATYATPAADGDRLAARVTGNIFTVWINGTQVATATDAFNNTATKFGIVVEA